MVGKRVRQIGKALKRAIAPLRYRLALMATRAGGKRPLRLLLITDGAAYTSEQQLAPFTRYATLLRQRLGLVTRHIGVERGQKLSPMALGRYDLIGLKFSFRASKESVHALARKICAAVEGSPTQLVYFDGDDDPNVMWPELTELCDRYIKKHAYRDCADYSVARIGKTNLTDYVARTTGRSFADDPFPSTAPVARAVADKVQVGWNIGLDDKIAVLAARMPKPSHDARPLDVCSRAFTPPTTWIHALRDPVATTLETMGSTMNVLVPRNRVAQDEYYREMQTSKICVSPFGYGEICWRDFEAILCGCLLVKPDMRHVETAPDIFIPRITYVPVKWDYSDLPEVCAHYLAHPEERQRIVDRAYAVVMESQTAEWFVERFEAVMMKSADRVAIRT